MAAAEHVSKALKKLRTHGHAEDKGRNEDDEAIGESFRPHSVLWALHTASSLTIAPSQQPPGAIPQWLTPLQHRKSASSV
jgi:hypothetical protein